MLLQRKSLAFVAPSGEKYLIFMLLKVRKWTVISPGKNYQNSRKTCFTTTKETALAPFNLAHPVCGYELPTNLQNLTKKINWSENIPKVLGGLLFWNITLDFFGWWGWVTRDSQDRKGFKAIQFFWLEEPPLTASRNILTVTAAVQTFYRNKFPTKCRTTGVRIIRV